MQAQHWYALIPFEGNINSGDTQGIKPYLQETEDIKQETEKPMLPFQTPKTLFDHFIGLANKYGWGALAFMVNTTEVKKNSFGGYIR